MQRYSVVLSDYNVLSKTKPSDCSGPTPRFCRVHYWKRMKRILRMENRTKARVQRLLTAAHTRAKTLCPSDDHPQTLQRYSSALKQVNSSSTKVQTYARSLLLPYQLSWTAPGVAISGLVLVLAVILIVLSLLWQTFFLHKSFAMSLVLLGIAAALRLTWYAMAMSNAAAPVSLQITSRLALVAQTLMFSLACFAWGSAVGELVYKKASAFKKRFLAVFLAFLSIVATLYAVIMVIICYFMDTNVYDAASLLLPLVQLVVVTLILGFALAGWKFLANVRRGGGGSSRAKRSSKRSSESFFTQRTSRGAEYSSSIVDSDADGVSRRLRALKIQVAVIVTILLCVMLHVIVAFIAEFSTLISYTLEILLRFLVVETIVSLCFLSLFWGALRPVKKHKDVEEYEQLLRESEGDGDEREMAVPAAYDV
jgi:hypothetical protein